MKVDKSALAVLVAGLLLVALAFVTPQPRSGAPGAETGAAQPEVEGRLLIYVNGELKYSGKVHSFLKPASTMLALGLFPVTGFRSASVYLYTEVTSTWSAWTKGVDYTETLTCADASYKGVWGTMYNVAPLLLVYDTKGAKWTEISLSTTPSIFFNATGVCSASAAPSPPPSPLRQTSL
jgi:hypothetical protein